MKKLLLLILLFPIEIFAQDTSLTKAIIFDSSITTISFTGKRMTFIGNSITAGFSATDTFHRWTNLFVASKGGYSNNLGISGQVMQYNPLCGSTTFDKTTIPTFTASDAILVISLGINDMGYNITSANLPKFDVNAFELKYNEVIQYAINTKSWPSYRIILITPYWINSTGYSSYVGTCNCTIPSTTARHDSYAQKVIDIAHNNNCKVVDVYSAMRDSPLNSTFLSGDGLHPNNIGHAFIANVITNSKFNY